MNTVRMMLLGVAVLLLSSASRAQGSGRSSGPPSGAGGLLQQSESLQVPGQIRGSQPTVCGTEVRLSYERHGGRYDVVVEAPTLGFRRVVYQAYDPATCSAHASARRNLRFSCRGSEGRLGTGSVTIEPGGIVLRWSTTENYARNRRSRSEIVTNTTPPDVCFVARSRDLGVR